MAFQAKDGSKHTNRDTMKQADMKHMTKSPMAEPDEDDQPEGMEDPQQDGTQMAQEHGPAHMIDIQHDHAGGRHSVHAMHPDGHEHETEHGSADAAHKFAGEVAGVGSHEGM